MGTATEARMWSAEVMRAESSYFAGGRVDEAVGVPRAIGFNLGLLRILSPESIQDIAM